jgi:hypothetical protein
MRNLKIVMLLNRYLPVIKGPRCRLLSFVMNSSSVGTRFTLSHDA